MQYGIEKLMKVLGAILLISLFSDCINPKSEVANTIQNRVSEFLISKRYTYSVDKSAIPIFIIDSLSILDNSPFKIGDSSDIKQINFSDASLGDYKFDRILNFVCLSDSVYLICYREGGIGTHDVVDYIEYYGITFNHLRYVTTDFISDTIKLEKYLKTNPKPEIIK
ncbi:MAG: hypothetical protein ABI723_05110 [Bacteroidia bacterium]